MKTHTLLCEPGHVHWGFLDADLPDVLHINPGDSVIIEAYSGGRSRLPEDRERFQVLPGHLTVIEKCVRKIGPHIITGPIHISGAEPGDLLSVHVDKVELIQNWGWNQVFIGDGVLPELEDRYKAETVPYNEGLKLIPLDLKTSEVVLPWGGRVPAKPFFGVMAVKPDHHNGPVDSLVPGVFGGNMDIRWLGKGTTIYFPVYQKGAGFSAGDGHALQGDGEVSGTAVETSLRGQFTFNLVKGAARTPFPYAEIPGHLIAMAVDENFDIANKAALQQAITLLTARYDLTEYDAYRHCSLLGNSANSQLVNRKRGVHYMVDVSTLPIR